LPSPLGGVRSAGVCSLGDSLATACSAEGEVRSAGVCSLGDSLATACSAEGEVRSAGVCSLEDSLATACSAEGEVRSAGVCSLEDSLATACSAGGVGSLVLLDSGHLDRNGVRLGVRSGRAVPRLPGEGVGVHGGEHVDRGGGGPVGLDALRIHHPL